MKRIVLALVALAFAAPSFAACNYNFTTPACFTSTVDLSAATVIGGTTSGTSAFEDITVSDDCTITDDLIAKDIDAGGSGNVGTLDIFPATASKGKLAITCADQTGDTTVTVTTAAMAAARTLTIPDPGAAASFVMSTGTSTATSATSTELTTLAGVTGGTAAASKAVVLDSSKNIATLASVTANQYRVTNATALTAADVNLTKAAIQAASFWPVDTTSNAVDVDFGDDAVLDAADVGTVKTFVVTVGGTNALTVTAGSAGVQTITAHAATTGTSAEDVGDMIVCTVYATAKAACITYAAD